MRSTVPSSSPWIHALGEDDELYSCNVTVTNRSHAPWIHAFGEDDELYSCNVTVTNRDDAR